jgi:methionyl-tRNA synthetase
MRLAALVNEYTSEQEPWALVKTDRERAGTVLYVALRCVDSLKILFTPFLPFRSQRLHELLGYEGVIAGPLDVREHEDGDGHSHTVLTGDYESWIGRWEPSALPPSQRLEQPKLLFEKLDPEKVVEEELRRMGDATAEDD